MYLKRLELQGFKSFPEKIKLDFNKGITAVVGPNGSGKSNISDAVRWVLGEQSAKSLRGAKMEDVIFAGTETRKSLGFAEVSIIIDNVNLKLSLPFTEIIVTRRVYRSGESEFSINGSSCRLKDIHELFMDTGIGKEGYSIIGQGKIDEILNARSDDRRLLFEEAAGIVKYRKRREETLIKLDREGQNLLRIEDIIFELEKQLAPLENQSEKAKKYLILRDELKILKVNIFLIDVTKMENEINEIEKQIENINFEIEDKIQVKNNYLEEIEKIKKISFENDNNYKNLNNEIIEIRSNLEQKSNDINLINEKNNFISTEIKRLLDEKETLEKDTNDFNVEKSFFERRLIELNTELSENKIELNKSQETLNLVTKKINQREKQIEKFNTDIIEGYRKSSEVKTNLNRVISFSETLDERKDEIIKEKSENNYELKDIQKKFENLNLESITINKEIEKLKFNLETLNNEKLEILNKTSFLDNQNLETIKKINQAESRFKIIKELEDDFEGYSRSIKAVLSKKKTDKIFNGINGAVGEVISVEEKYETAIEIALGFQVQNIITDTEEDAKLAIEYLRKTNQGRATFLPISSINGYSLKNFDEIAKNSGVCGLARDLIVFDEKYKNIFNNLLGRVVVCTNIDEAIKLAKKYKNTFKIVTINGDVLNSGGAMTGGSVNKKSTGIFTRRRELKELSESIYKLKLKQKELLISIEENNKLFVETNTQLTDGQNELIQKEKEGNALNYSLKQIEDLFVKSKEKFESLNIENKQLLEQISIANKEVNKNKEELLNSDKYIEEVKLQLEEFQKTIIFDKDSHDENTEKTTELKIKITSINENIKGTESNFKRINLELEKTNEKLEKIYLEIKNNDKEKDLNHLAIKNLEEEIDNVKKIQNEKKQLLISFEHTKNEIQEKTEKLNKLEREENQILLKLEKEKTRLEFKNEQLDINKRDLFNYMWDEYNITYQQALTFEKLEESSSFLHKREKAIKEEIELLGNININAIEEFKQVKERFIFLTKQQEDIVLAEEKLKDLIFELTNLMTKQFKEHFEVISENFSKVFGEMFEGGEAKLELMDENNILESGIEIVARPPGKNLQNMNLLSGGERALTAIALLFAILKMKPSPFCILDEIEAALDEANVKRYADYLKKLSSESQFIIITHRKGAMEAADVLYGVTMQEKGVSKLVSVSLEGKSNVTIKT